MFGALLLESSSKNHPQKEKTKKNFELDRQKQTTHTHTKFSRQKGKRGREGSSVWTRPAGRRVLSSWGRKNNAKLFFSNHRNERAARPQNSHTILIFFFPLRHIWLKNTFEYIWLRRQKKYVENRHPLRTFSLSLFTLFSPMKSYKKYTQQSTHTHISPPLLFKEGHVILTQGRKSKKNFKSKKNTKNQHLPLSWLNCVRGGCAEWKQKHHPHKTKQVSLGGTKKQTVRHTVGASASVCVCVVDTNTHARARAHKMEA